MRLPEPGTWKRTLLAYGAGIVVVWAGVVATYALLNSIGGPDWLVPLLLFAGVAVPFFLGGFCVGHLMQRSPAWHGFILGLGAAGVGILIMYVMLVLPPGGEHAWVGVLAFLFFFVPVFGIGGTAVATLGGVYAEFRLNRRGQ